MIVDLRRLETLARDATPGPWCWDANRNLVNEAGVFVLAGEPSEEIDAVYLEVASPDVVLALIEKVRAAEAVMASRHRAVMAYGGGYEGDGWPATVVDDDALARWDACGVVFAGA